MNQSSDAAEQIVKMSLEGFQVALKVSGSGAKNVAVFLYALAKNKEKIKGKTTLTNMLKYLVTRDYALLYIILIFMSLMVSTKFSQKLFKNSAMKSLREES